ncbi:omptin family outer membrane protease [Ochrobactrum sp. Q0168]|nr:omptin family outer membrane protease [Ochrobactrum sp. Q0168]
MFLHFSLAFAADKPADLQYTNIDKSFTFLGGVGYTWVKADEIVYSGGNRISHLFWQSQMPVLTGAFRAEPINNITMFGRAKVGLGGSHQMADYDWLYPHLKSYDFDDWTDLSISNETDLDRYINVDIAVGHDFDINQYDVFNLHGGFKYTNVKWTSSNSRYVYSRDGFRDKTGVLSGKGISYEQSLPALFVGGEWRSTFEKWSFSLLGRVGATVAAKDIDDHWRGNKRFTDTFGSQPFLDTEAEVSYAFTERAQVYFSAAYEKYFRMRGDTTMENRATGEVKSFPDDAGAGLQSFTLGGGVKVSF